MLNIIKNLTFLKERVQANEKLSRLKLLERAPQNNAIENGGLNKGKITQKIYNMCVDLIGEKVTRETVPTVSTSDDVLKLMAVKNK